MSKPPINPKHVLILGAGPGLSAAVAQRFGREGFEVTLLARSERNLTEVAERLRAENVTVNTVTGDAADTQQFRKTLESIAAEATPGVVIYNTCVIAPADLLSVDVDFLHSTYAVDVLGAISAVQVFTPAMREAGSGTFIATGGYASVFPWWEYASIALDKAALRNSVAMLHDQLKPEGVHVAGVTITGPIAPGTPAAPEVLAESFWDLHTQPQAEWTNEIYLDEQAQPKTVRITLV
jgi:short-subunit dehydrogenase